MKRTIGIACTLICFASTPALAQWPLAPAAPKVAADQTHWQHSAGMSQVSLSQLQPTPAMWFYEQARKQHENPKAAVRANAEFRSSQRLQRMAAREHYGISLARPAQVAAPAYSPLTSPTSYGAVPRTTVIVVPESKSMLGWK